MIGLAITVVSSAALWILFVAGVKPEEMIVGTICTLLTVAFSWYISRQCSTPIRIRAVDAFQIFYIPWYLGVGLAIISWVLIRDIFHLSRAESLFRAAPYTEIANSPVATARRVLAVAYTTATPNFIIIGIDCQTQRMLFHQLKKTNVPKMTRRLGAQV